MVPLSVRITKGEPAFAQAVAHSALIGFFRPLVNAHAESRTYPLTVIGFPASLSAPRATTASTDASKSFGALRRFIFGILLQVRPYRDQSARLRGLCRRAFAECGRHREFPCRRDVQASPRCTICPATVYSVAFSPAGPARRQRSLSGSSRRRRDAFSVRLQSQIPHLVRVIVKPDAGQGYLPSQSVSVSVDVNELGKAEQKIGIRNLGTRIFQVKLVLELVFRIILLLEPKKLPTLRVCRPKLLDRGMQAIRKVVSPS